MNREQRLDDFVQWWRAYCKGDEKGEAQIFLDRLFTAFGYPDGLRGAQGDPEKRITFRVEEKSTTKFADLVIPGRAVVEMKKRGEDLRKHHQQAFSYWSRLTPHPRYMLLCNFDEFWVYDMERMVDDPMGKVPVANLAEDWGPLAFLFPQEEKPVFNREFDLIELTEQAANSLGQVFYLLSRPQRGVKREQAQRFILQCMVALFAEDIGLLPRYTFTRIIEDCQNGQSTADLMNLLFVKMNMPGVKSVGRFHGVEYFNGGLFDFKHIYDIHLTPEELRLLREAANHNWARIRPAIFGTIFETSMDQAERHQVGAHFTSDRDILRIVEPVIVRPWQELIDSANTAADLKTLHHDLCNYRVLDPACGSGNFLYIAYREMKKLEQRLFDRLNEIEGNGQGRLGQVNAHQFYGFDIKPFAVELAKVTLMIAKKLAVDELHSLEQPLPLDNLDSNIRAADALLEAWPEFDACIGNPPYLGAKRMKQEHPPEYINRVRAAFPEVPGNADYCVYWFRKAHELMKPGARAGLVGTNTIRQNYSREGGLDYIAANDGIIYEAVSSTPWSGEAKVHISIACWSKGDAPYTPYRLWEAENQFVEVSSISPSLSQKTDVSSADVLKCNVEPKRVYLGQQTSHISFLLSPDEAAEMVRADLFSRQVIYPYLIGRDLLTKSGSKPSRYSIDFGERDIVEASTFKVAYKHLVDNVLPDVEAKAKIESDVNKKLRDTDPGAEVVNSHTSTLSKWWLFHRRRTEMVSVVSKLDRYIVCSEVTKRPIFDFVSSKIRPDHTLIVFALADDYSYGILQSNIHWQWVVEKASTLKSDYRYTPHSIFDTFPWPQSPTPAQVKAVAEAGRALHEYRRGAMARNPKLTLRELYRSLELPGKNPLKDLHAALDAAVLAAYGFAAQSPEPLSPGPFPRTRRKGSEEVEGESAPTPTPTPTPPPGPLPTAADGGREGESDGREKSRPYTDGGGQDVLAQLLALNAVVAGRIERGEPVTAPGIPADYPDPAELVSAGCIQPPELI